MSSYADSSLSLLGTTGLLLQPAVFAGPGGVALGVKVPQTVHALGHGEEHCRQ